jgi:hypothetical protein
MLLLLKYWKISSFFLSDAATDKKFTNKTRSNIALGAPLAGFKNEEDNKEMQGMKKQI